MLLGCHRFILLFNFSYLIFPFLPSASPSSIPQSLIPCQKASHSLLSPLVSRKKDPAAVPFAYVSCEKDPAPTPPPLVSCQKGYVSILLSHISC